MWITRHQRDGQATEGHNYVGTKDVIDNISLHCESNALLLLHHCHASFWHVSANYLPAPTLLLTANFGKGVIICFPDMTTDVELDCTSSSSSLYFAKNKNIIFNNTIEIQLAGRQKNIKFMKLAPKHINGSANPSDPVICLLYGADAASRLLLYMLWKKLRGLLGHVRRTSVLGAVSEHHTHWLSTATVT